MEQSVLIFRPDHLGDMLLTTPVLRLLKSARPDVRITVAAGNWTRPILERIDCVDAVIPCHLPWLDRSGSAGWTAALQALRRMRAGRFDAVFNFRVAAKSALVVRLTNIRIRWGLNAPKCAWAHTHTAEFSDQRHMVEQWCDVIRGWTGTAMSAGPLEFPVSHAEQQEAARFLQSLGVAEPFILCAPGAGYPMKLWPEDRWAACILELRLRQHMPVLLIGGAEEYTQFERIRTASHNDVRNLAGRCSIALSAALLQRCAVLVAVDSFTMHLGASQQAPVVALFGPTSPRLWGPWPDSGNHRIVASNPDGPYFKQDSAAARALMSRIPVDDVVQAVESVIRK